MQRHSFLPSVLAALALAVLATPARAAWPHDPYSEYVGVALATSQQVEPAVCSDGAGGMIVAWTDARSGSNDIYAQRIAANGTALWTANGVVVCSASGTQSGPVVLPDGAGGAFVAWTDSRTGSLDLYAQRLGPTGASQWTANGVAVCTATNSQDSPVLASDGAGGVMIAWRDFRSATNYDVYAQRLNSAGTVQWTANGVAACTQASDQGEVRIVAGTANDCIIVWSDLRNSAVSGRDLFGQRLSSAGSTLWTANGATLIGYINDQNQPYLVPNGLGGFLLCFSDPLGGDVTVASFSANPSLHWAVALTSVANTQNFPMAASDGAGGAIVAWHDFRADGATSDIYATRITSSGTLPWTANGVALTTAANVQTLNSVCSDGAGGLIATWYDLSNPTLDVLAQRVNANGSALWGTNGALVGGGPGGQTTPVVVTGLDSEGMFAYVDNRLGTNDVMAQRVDKYGRAGDPAAAITQVRDVAADQGGSVKLSWDASYLDADPTYGIFEYRVFRSSPVTLAQAAAARRAVTSDADVAAATGALLVLPNAANATAWEYVGTQAAEALASYSRVVATTSDSGAAGNKRTQFMVEARAGTAASSQRWFSAPDSGYSVDNLAPLAPAPLTGQFAAGTTRLHWNPNTEPDLAGYRVYRGTDAAFTPSPATLVEAVTDTGYADPAGVAYVYKLTAVDEHGNESPVATLVPSGTLGVKGGAALALEFAAPQPNPARGATTLRWTLPSAARVKLALYDAAGRRVATLADGAMDAGAHSATLALRDSAGRALPSGVYLARLECGGRTLTRRIAVIR
ncbi:MAG: T9SS type A sorting domain-containing protein [Candidatus Eisenbacteria bacterium]